MAQLSIIQRLGLLLLGHEASRPATLPHTLFADIGENEMPTINENQTQPNSQTFNLNGARATVSVTIQYPDNLDADHLEELKQYFEILHQSLVKKASRAVPVPTQQIVHPARNTISPEWQEVPPAAQG